MLFQHSSWGFLSGARAGNRDFFRFDFEGPKVYCCNQVVSIDWRKSSASVKRWMDHTKTVYVQQYVGNGTHRQYILTTLSRDVMGCDGARSFNESCFELMVDDIILLESSFGLLYNLFR